MSDLILPVIMCGGAGARLWPASRETLPKQFMPLFNDISTFQDTLLRVMDPELFLPPLIITNNDFRFLVAEQARALDIKVDIILEPSRQDSAAAVAVATLLAKSKYNEQLVLILAADHAVSDVMAFRKACKNGAEAALAGKIVTFGIMPDRPSTAYGYIKPGAHLKEGGAYCVDAFVEKPNQKLASQYIEEGYLWNSGNFLFHADVMHLEFETYAPEILKHCKAAISKNTADMDFIRLNEADFTKVQKIPVDYAIMEKTAHAAVLPVAMGWSDIGSWDAVWELSSQDKDGNAITGSAHIIDSKNVLVRSDDGMLTTVVGLDNVVVIATIDAVLVVSREKAGSIKKLVEELKQKSHRTTYEHARVQRPWGSYQGVDSGARHQVKRITVKPDGKLSLQKHFHRAEHWVVVSGTAEVTLDGHITTVQENQSIHIPIGAVHRLHNPGRIPLELIEVQVGSYLGEDDILRIEDMYNRE